MGLRVYVYLHRSGFLKGYKLSQLYKYMLDSPLFLCITAEQEQVVKLLVFLLNK